jgi:putative restriction endonuclease
MLLQQYEKYWEYTAAFTNYNGKKFIGSLKLCVGFIDQHLLENYSSSKYVKLQTEMEQYDSAARPSIRKKINQLVKMGFINSQLTSYHPVAKKYLNAESNDEREILLSKVIYSNSSLSRSVKEDSKANQISFLINTLVQRKSLTRDEIVGLMLVDVEEYKQPYISKEDLAKAVLKSKEIDFEGRKYNQISHFINLLKKLNNLSYVEHTLYFKDDAPEIISRDSIETRNSYLQQLYKNELKEESVKIYGKPVCMIQKIDYPYRGFYIASHIKPYRDCDDNEKFDPMNGLLLSLTMDALFDRNLISFSDEGDVIFSKRIKSQKLKDFLNSFKIDNKILKMDRLKYLKYHRDAMNQIDSKKNL